MQHAANGQPVPSLQQMHATQRFQRERRKICPRSDILTPNFDFAEHDREWQDASRRYSDRKNAYRIRSMLARQQEHGTPYAVQPPIRAAFGQTNPDNFNHHIGTVTLHETAFSPVYYNNVWWKIADWPEKAEFKYEGDDRISTDKLHGRFFPLPRIKSNETVNWQQRLLVPLSVLDKMDYQYRDVEVFTKNFWIPELEFDDEEGKEIIGAELMGLLDPDDIW